MSQTKRLTRIDLARILEHQKDQSKKVFRDPPMTKSNAPLDQPDTPQETQMKAVVDSVVKRLKTKQEAPPQQSSESYDQTFLSLLQNQNLDIEKLYKEAFQKKEGEGYEDQPRDEKGRFKKEPPLDPMDSNASKVLKGDYAGESSTPIQKRVVKIDQLKQLLKHHYTMKALMNGNTLSSNESINAIVSEIKNWNNLNQDERSLVHKQIRRLANHKKLSPMVARLLLRKFTLNS